MNNRTDSTTQSVHPTETTSRVEKDEKTRPSRMRALVRRLMGHQKSGKADVQQYPLNRTLRQMVALYAPDHRPEPQDKEAARLIHLRHLHSLLAVSRASP
jgi:hypothetical protein